MVSEVSWYIGVGSAIISTLGALNIFFIVRLVKKIEMSAETIIGLRVKVDSLSEKILAIGGLHDRMMQVEKDMAILQYVAKRHHPETLCDHNA